MAHEARPTDEFDSLLDRVVGGERVIVRRRGKRFGLVSGADLDRLAELDRLEAEDDLAAADAALAEAPTQPYEDLRRRLGLI